MDRNQIKQDNKKKAEEHYSKMKVRYVKEIQQSIDCTLTYIMEKDEKITVIDNNGKIVKTIDNNILSKMNNGEVNADIKVVDMDTAFAAYKFRSSGSVTLLNFASYKHPGGGFLNGMIAQEEALCHDSVLYNIIEKMEEFYEYNNKQENNNNNLYKSRALYSPQVIFEKNNTRFACNIITCAAPNKKAALNNRNINEKQNTKELINRIKLVLSIAADNNTDTLILGAWGCGVFGQDPKEVAQIFKNEIESEFKDKFKQIIFAIPSGGKTNNLKIFRDTFNK